MDLLLPNNIKESLNANVLNILVMCQRFMGEKDFLFFYHIILPFCGPTHPSVTGNKRIPYFLVVDSWSKLYAFKLFLGGRCIIWTYFNNINYPVILGHDG